MDVKITSVLVKDIRFPTSRTLDGSDAMNTAPDYSAAYVMLQTDHADGREGHGLTFTTGRGTEVVVQAIHALAPMVKGQSLEEITANLGAFWKRLVGDAQLRWLGPEKGVMHLATAAVVNAVWDLVAKAAKKPLWQLLADMTPAEWVRCIDFRYITDALTPEEALDLLEARQDGRAARLRVLREAGYPGYTTSAGWLGYPDEKVRHLCREAIAEGWTHIKMKVGTDIEQDLRRARLIREEIGPDRVLMMDANQVWEVDEAIQCMHRLQTYNPWFIEEPTNPDDILGHARIAKAISPVQVATGGHAQNRIIIKQMLQAGALQVCQPDVCRLGGVNEYLAVLLMAAKFGVPVCPHGGGVGLCEYIQHLSMADFIAVSGTMDGRVIEYVDHLHEHFLHPVTIEAGRYRLPEAIGCTVQMRPESLEQYAYPKGPVWQA